MADTLNARQLIQLAKHLTRFQSTITDYELRHYSTLDDDAKNEIEEALSLLATAAGRLYAYSVQLVFPEAAQELVRLGAAAEGLNTFLQTTLKIQRVLDIVTAVASLAGAVISHDIEGITLGIDEIIQMAANN